MRTKDKNKRTKSGYKWYFKRSKDKQNECHLSGDEKDKKI